MKTIRLFLIILFFLHSNLWAMAPQNCLNQTNALLGHGGDPHIWAKANSYLLNRKEGLDTLHITPLKSDEISLGHQQIMDRLKKNGGTGEYVKTECFHTNGKCFKKVTGVRILSPPKMAIYGSSFGEIFHQLDEADIPLIVSDNISGLNAQGLVFTINQLSDSAKSVMFLHRLHASNIVNRHEFQHALDRSLRIDEFRRELPQKLDSILARIFEKVDRKEPLTSKDFFKTKRIFEYVSFLLEMRASGVNLANLFTKRGLKEIFEGEKVPQGTSSYLTELSHYAKASRHLALYGVLINPLNPKNMVLILKATGSNFLNTTVTLSPFLLTILLIYFYSFLTLYK